MMAGILKGEVLVFPLSLAEARDGGLAAPSKVGIVVVGVPGYTKAGSVGSICGFNVGDFEGDTDGTFEGDCEGFMLGKM
jgi:hypothetical protein